MSSFPYFYYEGDCNDPNQQTAIKGNFISILRSGRVVPIFCSNPTLCNENTIKVYCGNVSAAERRRKRSTTMQVNTPVFITISLLYYFLFFFLSESKFGSAEQLSSTKSRRPRHGSDSNVVLTPCRTKFINFGNVF